MTLPPLGALPPSRFDDPAILKALAAAGRQLAELKGIVASIPNQAILVNTLALQEAKDSSAVENIVTTHDELFRDAAGPEGSGSPAAKEVLRYRQALRVGFDRVKTSGLLTSNHLKEIQSALVLNNAGFRRVPGTTLKDGDGQVVYTPPQDAQDIEGLMSDLQHFMNDSPAYGADALIRMALAHHRFESIHPFYDGNGRTGRILNVLYLVKEGLLNTPVLYFSRHIVRTKARYYELLQSVRDEDQWEDWVQYMLEAVEVTAREGIATVTGIREALFEVKHHIRTHHRGIYSQDLLNNLFAHPYTKVQFVQDELEVSRVTATKYLDALAEDGTLQKMKLGRTNFYMNVRLLRILTADPMQSPAPAA